MNKRISFAGILALSGSFVALAAGCMEVRPASVRTVEVEAVKLQSFPPDSFPVEDGVHSITMRNVKGFLWGEGIPPEEVAQIKKLSVKIDEAEDAGVRLTQEIEFLENQQNGAFRRYKQSTATIESQSRVRELALARKAEAESQLEEELAKPEDQQNANRIRVLRRQIDMHQGRIDSADEAIESAEVMLAHAMADAAEAGLDFVKIEAEIDEKEERKQRFSDAGTEMVNELSNTVSFYASINFVRISFPPEGVKVEVNAWDFCMYADPFGDGVRVEPLIGEYLEACYEYDYTVENVTYEPLGGRLKFRVVSAVGARFEFDIVRTRYADELGRLFMQGRIEATFDTDRGPVERHGIVKLVDSKN